MNHLGNVLLLTKFRECFNGLELTFESIFGFYYCCLCISYIGSLLVNLLSFVGGGDLTFAKRIYHLCSENSLKIDNCHIDYKLKWKLKTVTR